MKHTFTFFIYFLLSIQSAMCIECQPNEVLRKFLKHLNPTQRKSVARISRIWALLVKSFQDKLTIKAYSIAKEIDEEWWQQLVDSNLPLHVTLFYPITRVDLLCNPLVTKICFDIQSIEALDRFSDWQQPVHSDGTTYQNHVERLLVALEEHKTNQWSLYMHLATDKWDSLKCSRPLKLDPYLKKIKLENRVTESCFSPCTLRFDLDFTEFSCKYVIFKSHDSTALCTMRSTYYLTRENPKPHFSVGKLMKKYGQFPTVCFNNVGLVLELDKPIIELFETYKCIENIIVPEADIPENKRVDFVNTLANNQLNPEIVQESTTTKRLYLICRNSSSQC